MRALRWVGVWALALAASGCAAHRTVEHRLSSGPGWPPGDPRFRLESVIDLSERERGAGRRVLRWLGEDVSSERFRRPYAVTWAGNDLIVADPDARRVARIERGGRIRLSPEGVFRHPIGAASCLGGIVVSDADAGRVALLDQHLGLSRWLATDLSRPTGVACGGDRVFVVETGKHRVLILDGQGGRETLGGRGVGPAEFNYPASITMDAASVWVGDTLNFRIQNLDAATGEYLGAFGRLGDSPGEMPRIKGIAVDRSGHVWVSDAHLDRVSLYDRSGVLLISIGRTGRGEGEFSFPAGIAAHPDGRIAVVDSLNRRVQIFRVLESLPTTEGGGGPDDG